MWKCYLYYKRQCIKMVKLHEEEKPMDKLYDINVYFKKHLLGSNKVRIIVRPTAIKLTKQDKKEIHIETELWEGVIE